MGSIGSNTSTGPVMDSNFQRFLDNVGGDENLAIKDWIYEDISDHVEYKGKEYDIMWENSIRTEVISRPTGEQFDKDLVVTVQVDLINPDTGERVDNYWLKDSRHPNKRRRFHIPYYD